MCRSRRAPVSVKTDAGWVTIRRHRDRVPPARKLARAFGVLALALAMAAIYLSFVATKPLEIMRRALARVSEGDLDHRLDVRGPKELRDLAASFNAMTGRVKEMLEMERGLMAGISHELRTPLARLRLEVELLRDAGTVGDKRLDSIERDLSEMDGLIGELLEISRLAIGERKLDVGPVDLNGVVQVAVERTGFGPEEIEVQGHADTVEGDSERLVRVVTNLLTNAKKYGERGARIHLDGRTITVSDSGPGVPAEELSRLFEPFFRSARGPKRQGLGLGLMIAKQIVDLHGGNIRAENRPEGGLSVRVELPAQPKNG